MSAFSTSIVSNGENVTNDVLFLDFPNTKTGWYNLVLLFSSGFRILI